MKKERNNDMLPVDPCNNPSGWVDVNLDTIIGWVWKHCPFSIDHEDVKHDAYVAAICAANIVVNKGKNELNDGGRYFRSTFYNQMKQLLFVPRISTIPFSAMFPDDENSEGAYTTFIDVYAQSTETDVFDDFSQSAIDVFEHYWDEITVNLKEGERLALETSLGLTHRGVMSCRDAELMTGKKKSTISSDSSSGVIKLIDNINSGAVTTHQEPVIVRKKNTSGKVVSEKVIYKKQMNNLVDILANVITNN